MQIEINQRLAWRRGPPNLECEAADIGTTRLFGDGEGSLDCRIGCIGMINSLDFHCTNIDLVEDWVAGERTYTYNISRVTNFEAS